MGIIEGRNPVIEALRAGRPVSRILLERNIRGGNVDQILSLANIKGIPVEYVDRQVIERQCPAGSSQGVIALAAAKKYISLDELLALSRGKNEPPLYIILDGIEDPHNLGAILRTAEATGVHGVVIRERRAVGLTPAVAKASAGAVEYVPVAMVSNISQAVLAVQKNNLWVTGIDMAGEMDYSSVDFKLPAAIVIGGEGRGLSDLVRKRCDFVARIPMRGRIASLNASVAAAVVMYEVVRQRGL
ncbi:MAG: 23S rRNA (guanosine(2251)-2'-O)-methyltransferase RlmB [Dehalococcoidia bacterium]|nr:23S rRNA (guanosine(2251)-2'-O)-methyltransferase RlmB [Dehalococcoidia bacterium]MDD5493960.1 23S rRNA (guanosine(2251)-2'-O)-methyltransferase RlmB [Dehalococcoidia bacterium]